MPNLHVSVSLRGEHISESLAAADIHAMSLGVDERVIRIPAGVKCVQEATVLLTEHAHLRRMAKHRDHLSARLIESQGEVRPQTVRCPARDLSVRRTIHDRDLVRVGVAALAAEAYLPFQ